MNTIHMSIQDEKGILRFSKGNISYKVNVNSKESRLECIKQLRKILEEISDGLKKLPEIDIG